MGIGIDVYVALVGDSLFVALLIGWALTKNRRGEPEEEDG